MTGERRESLRSKLRSGRFRIGVWGLGFIGYSTIAHFANEGTRCIGYDVDPDVVQQTQNGEIPVSDLEYWLGFDTRSLVEDGLIEATTDADEILSDDVLVHFLAIPTERDGEPWEGALRETAERLAAYAEIDTEEPVLVIVESTLTPGMSDDVIFDAFESSGLEIGTDILVGVAPRRDWFISPDKNLRSLPRVYGGQDARTNERMESVLGIVCNNLVEAPDHHHAELVKSIENAYRHVGITLANQLSRAYTDIDMREVLQLVGTKWNIPTYYPSIGTGGYCIPLSSQYVLAGTDNPDELSILHDTIETDRDQPRLTADALAAHGAESVAVLGFAYKGDVKVDILSPTKPIVDRLQEHGVSVAVNDPYYDDEYIEAETGAESITFPAGLRGRDAVLIVADHQKYKSIPHDRILDAAETTTLVVDNQRTWEDLPLEDHGIEYYYTGAKGWLGPAMKDRPAARPE